MGIEQTRLDLELGWRGVPGWFSEDEAMALARAVRRALPGSAVVELGSWCGRSLAVAADALPAGVCLYSVDCYPEVSQAAAEADGQLTAGEARAMRDQVVELWTARGRRIVVQAADAAVAGRAYEGPPVAVLLIDDHHSAEQLKLNLEAWMPHLAAAADVLLHDYGSLPYGLQPVAQSHLSAAVWWFDGLHGSIGVYRRHAL